MVNKSRIAQYMPMDALKGLQEALRHQEEAIEHQKILFEDTKETVNQTLKKLKIKDVVEVLYYDRGKYIRLIGEVKSLNMQELCINTTKIAISMLYYIDVQ